MKLSGNVDVLIEINSPPLICPLCSAKVKIEERSEQWFVCGNPDCLMCGDFGISTDTERELRFIWNLSVTKCLEYEMERLRLDNSEDVIYQKILTMIDLLDNNENRIFIVKFLFGNYLFPELKTDNCLVRCEPKNFVKLRFYKDI